MSLVSVGQTPNLRLLRVVIAAIVLGVLGVGVLRAVIVARRFSAPVEALVEQSARITHGDLEPGEPIVSPVTEIHGLVEALDQMRQGILAKLKLEKVERDLDLAREIQLGLLPKTPPEVAGFEIAGWNEPADQTGGDYYDWQELPDGRTAITIADVTGHGIGPALVTTVCRAYARAYVQGGEALAAIVARLNDLLHEDLPGDRFVTFAMVLIDSKNHVAEYLSAGHGPILCYSAAAGAIENMNADGVPLGIMPDAEYDAPHRMQMAPGDMLVLITDGFFEWARADGDQYGVPRLADFICRHAALSPAELIRRLHESVREFVGDAAQQDDLTAVIVKRTT